MRFLKNPFFIFYIVFSYIVVFSIWWAYLLFKKNETAFYEKVEINAIYYNQTHSIQDYLSSPNYLGIKEKYERQKTMILLEGSVFVLLLIAGLLMVKRILDKEMRLGNLQRNFMLSITHELKSPLAAIKLNLQTIKARELEKHKVNKLMENSVLDINRLESLIENILFASKLESNENHLTVEEVNISDVTGMLIDRFSTNLKQIIIQEDIQADVYLHTDPIGYISMVSNLLENALKYSEPSSQISVKLSCDKEKVSLTFTDQGHGIPESEREHVFQKFYRIGDENTRKSKGTGLGLYIVKKFIDIQKGEITLGDNQPNGTIFMISLPLT